MINKEELWALLALLVAAILGWLLWGSPKQEVEEKLSHQEQIEDSYIRIIASAPEMYVIAQGTKTVFHLRVEYLDARVYMLQVRTRTERGLCMPSCPFTESNQPFTVIDSNGKQLPFAYDWKIELEEPGEHTIWIAVTAFRRFGVGIPEEAKTLNLPFTIKVVP